MRFQLQSSQADRNDDDVVGDSIGTGQVTLNCKVKSSYAVLPLNSRAHSSSLECREAATGNSVCGLKVLLLLHGYRPVTTRLRVSPFDALENIQLRASQL